MPHFTEAKKAHEEMKAEEQKTVSWFFTFGHGHPLANCYVGVIAPHSNAAREAMFRTFKGAWAFQYETNDPDNGLMQQIESYSIQPVFHLSADERKDGVLDVYLIAQSQFAFASAIEKRRRKVKQ